MYVYLSRSELIYNFVQILQGQSQCSDVINYVHIYIYIYNLILYSLILNTMHFSYQNLA